MKILYILRVCGNAGGMETYVYETARALTLRGHTIHVLCAHTHADTDFTGLEVHTTGPIARRRSWEARWNFRSEVSRLLPAMQKAHGFDIVHAHENTLEHAVTTQHGPCLAPSLRRKPWKYLDPSARRNLRLERDKFTSPSLKAVVGCSQRVCDILAKAYPMLADGIIRAIPPAFNYAADVPATPRARPLKTLGFIGYDWERKGLPRAITILKKMRHMDPQWRMRVGGVEHAALPWLLRRRLPEGIEFLGRTDAEAFYRSIGVLVHPARDEPFGMVIPEALSHGVPVAASDQCGSCAHIDSPALLSLSLGEPDATWINACKRLAEADVSANLKRGWDDVADDHERLYEEVLGK